jgi:hypothetical protein
MREAVLNPGAFALLRAPGRGLLAAAQLGQQHPDG